MEIDVVPDGKKSDSLTSDAPIVINNTEDGDEPYFSSLSENLPGCSSENFKCLDSRLHSNSHNKKVIKHALRQQAKRRRKNTTIASGNTPTIPRIICKLPPQPQPPSPPEELSPSPVKTPTMREVLASIPGFSIKPRKRSNKKLSTAAQLEQTKEGCIDLETPDSILVNTNLRALLNKHTFSILPPLYQYKLVQLLPDVDRQGISQQPDVPTRLSTSGLNNEFFARACLEWRERLAEGEFTPENQQKLKSEAEREKSKLDPWKLKHFEPIWGEKNPAPTGSNNIILQSRTSTRPSLKTTIKLRPTTSISSRHSKPAPTFTKRLRTVGAITRAITNFREENDLNHSPPIAETSKSAIPDLIPIKTSKHHADVPPIIQRPEIVISQMQSNDSNESLSFNNDDVDPLQITESSMDSNETRSSELVAISVPCGTDTTNTELPSENISETFSGKITDIIKVEKRVRSPSPDCNEPLPKKLSLSPLNSSLDEKIKFDDVLEIVKANDPDLLLEDDDEEEEEYKLKVDQLSEFEDKVDSNSEIITGVDCDSSKDFKEIADDICSESETIQKIEIIQNDINEFHSNLNSNDDCIKEMAHVIDDQASDLNSSVELEVPEPFAMLPNSLILQQESIVISKDCVDDSIEETAEKLEATVEESDLVLTQLGGAVAFDQSENTNADGESDFENSEERFLDAETYVLESGAIADLSTSSLHLSDQQNEESKQHEDDETEEDRKEIHAALFGAGVPRADECWGVDSSTEKLLADVPLHELDSVPVSMSVVDPEPGDGEDVAVIPMKEELEVRLEEGSFSIPEDWPYGVKMDSEMVAAALETADNLSVSDNSAVVTQFSEYSLNQVKLELEVTLTPEIVNTDSLVTSSVGGSSSSMTSAVPSVSKTTVATVIPPTTIVCLPSVVSTSSLIHPQSNQLSSSSSANNFIPNSSSLPRSTMVASSSAVPYLALSTSQPMRAVTTHTKSKSKSSSKDVQPSSGNGSNRNRNSSNKPPPGAVNLERSYQICQAVIQNSPNRDQLRCQLKPPPSLLAATNNNNNNTTTTSSNSKKSESGRATQYGTVTSSRNGNKPFTPPLPASANFTVIPSGNGVKQVVPPTVPGKIASGTTRPGSAFHQQRQPSPGPVLVRHLFTSTQGIPVTMAVLPPPTQAAVSPEVSMGSVLPDQFNKIRRLKAKRRDRKSVV